MTLFIKFDQFHFTFLGLSTHSGSSVCGQSGMGDICHLSGHECRALAAKLMDIFVFGGDINGKCNCSGAKRTANHFISNNNDVDNDDAADHANDTDNDDVDAYFSARFSIRLEYA